MSVRVAPTPQAGNVTRTRSHGITLSAAVAAPVVVAIGTIALIWLTWLAWGDLTHDTGYDWVAAQRLAQHLDRPYADFPYYYGPLGLGLLASAYRVFGAGVEATVALGLALAAASVGLTYLLARRVAGPVPSAFAALLAATAAVGAGNMNFILPHATSAPVAIVLVLATLLAAASYARSGARALLVAAGIAAGLVTLTRPEFVVAVFAAMGLWLALRVAAARSTGRRRAFGDAAMFLGPAVLVPAVAYGLILTQVSLRHLLDRSLAPASVLDAGGRHVLRLAAPMSASSFAKLAAELAVYALLCMLIAGVALLVRRGGRARLVAFAALGLAGVALLAILIADPEAARSKLRFAFAWIPAGAPLAVIVLLWRARGPGAGREWSVSDQTALLVAVVLTVLAAKTYASFLPQPNAEIAQFAIYAMPFAAVFLVWLHTEALGRDHAATLVGTMWVGALCIACVALAAQDGRHETGTVRAAHGTLAVPSAQVGAFQGAVNAIQSRTAPGEPILLAPQLSALSTLTGRPQATSPVSLLPGALATRADERRAIAGLADVRLAIIDPRPLTEYGQGAFGITFDRDLWTWLTRNFHRVAVLGGADRDHVSLDLWQRSAP